MNKKTIGKHAPKGEEIIVKAHSKYEDERGRIDYFVLPEAVNWIGVITSKTGTVRANHYHPRQEQKTLILSGKCVCIYKDLKKKNSPIKHHLAKAGDLVITAPQVAHAVVYLEDTMFLNLVRGEREPTNYGKHTLPLELVKKSEIKKYMAAYGKE